jgi:2,3-bisphosphoglycerate-dependent phosphoglycerate mutase
MKRTAISLRNPLEAAGGVMKPEYVRARQELHRMGQVINGRQTRMYDAAITDEYNMDFRGIWGSANSEWLQSTYQTIARGRRLAQRSAYAKAARRVFSNEIVGRDFKLNMRVGKYVAAKAKPDPQTGEVPEGDIQKFVENEPLNRAIEKEWKLFGQPANFTTRKDMSRAECFGIMVKAAMTDGNAILRHWTGFPNPVKYAVELLESDHLQQPFMGVSGADGAFGAGNPIRFSIEYDRRWKFPVAYWLLTRHPQDPFIQSIYGGSINTNPSNYTSKGTNEIFREQVPADDVVLYNNIRERPEQDIGFSEFDAGIQPLWKIEQYEKSLVIAAINSCIKPFVVTKQFPTGLQPPLELQEEFTRTTFGGQEGGEGGIGPGGAQQAGQDASERQQGIGNPVEKLSPGQTKYYQWGEKPEILDPKFPIEAAHEFRLDNVREFGQSIGLAYQSITGDYQNLGFAAALMCMTPQQDNMKIRQDHFVDNVVFPVFAKWLKAAILSGVFERKYQLDVSITQLSEYIESATFQGKRWAFVNPLVQAQTLIIMMEAGIISPQQVQDQLPDGIPIEQLYTFCAEARDEANKHGLDFSNADVTRPTISKGEPGQTVPTPQEQGPNGEPQPTPATKPGNPVRSQRAAKGRVFIVRHGATDMNGESNGSDDRIRGHLDVPLNDDGIREAHKAADKLQEADISRVYASDLKRAKETGRIIGDRTDAPVKTFYDLRPWNLGPDLQGQKTKDVMPEIERMVNNPDDAPDAGESFNQFKNRFFNCFDTLTASNAGSNIVAVLHYRDLKLLQSRNAAGSFDKKQFLSFDKKDHPGSMHEFKDGQLIDFEEPQPAQPRNAEIMWNRGRKSMRMDIGELLRMESESNRVNNGAH